MSSVDTAWLRMDRPSNLMMIVGVLTLEHRVSIREMRRLVSERMLGFQRFRQRPVVEPAGAFWENDPNFRIERQVTRLPLAHVRQGESSEEAALKETVARLAVTPLDPKHPLWSFALIERYRGGSALIARFHHCYADGIALIGVMLSLTDPSAHTNPTPRTALPPPEPDASAAEPSPLEYLFEPITDALAAAARASGDLLERVATAMQNPAELIDYARIGAAIATEVAQLALMPDDSATRFKGTPGLTKRVAWTSPLALDEVKAVGRALHASVNDVLLACVAGALRGYLAAHGEAREEIELRAMIPVNLRPPGKAGTLGNRFGLVALTLPVGLSNPIARLHTLRARMDALKRSYQAPITLGILGLVGVCPKPVQEQVLDLLASKATAVMTNVPGPQQPLYLGGAKIDSMMFWVPQSGNIGMGVSILSYDGKVQFGLITDAGLTPDPEAIIARFGAEFERLLLTVLMEPWGEPREPALVDAELARAERATPRGTQPARYSSASRAKRRLASPRK